MNYSFAIEDDSEYILSKQKLQKIINIANDSPVLYFYGAGLRSEEFLQIIKEGFPFFKKPNAFVISNNTNGMGHTQELEGIPIFTVDEIDLSKDDICVIVVAMDIYHKDITDTLERCGCKNYLFITNDMEHIITRDFLLFYFEKHKLKADFLFFDRYYKLDESLYENKIRTFSVMCEKDSILNSKVPDASWISNIQAGAYNASKIVSEYRDDEGDNISNLNSYYNELTGLYWVWKNTDYQFTGICHYRRRFESDIVLMPLLEEKADIVLPLPFVVGQDLFTYYQHWGLQIYYDEMLNVVKENYPDYYETAKWCASHIVFIPNNICITNRDILDEYCNFLFGVVDEVEKRMSKKDSEKQKRCWLSEHVSTIFFIKCMNKYRVVFGNLKRFW